MLTCIDVPGLPPPRTAQVKVTPLPGKRMDHQGIRVQLVGEVELASERGHPHEFLSLGEHPTAHVASCRALLSVDMMPCLRLCTWLWAHAARPLPMGTGGGLALVF